MRVAILLMLLAFGIGFGCDWLRNVKTESNRIDLKGSQPEPPSAISSGKEIFILIGRGSCCDGHIISVNSSGEVTYLVGTYHLANSSEGATKMREFEKFDLKQITVNTRYPRKNLSLPRDVIDRLAELVQQPDRLYYEDNRMINDAYHLTVYVDSQNVASGFWSPKGDFSEQLTELLNLVLNHVKLYELGGMA